MFAFAVTIETTARKYGNKMATELAVTRGKRSGSSQFSKRKRPSMSTSIKKGISLFSLLMQKPRVATAKSARRKNAKYALVSITLEIEERTPVEPLTQEDDEMHKTLTYYVDQTGVQLVHWLGNPIEEKIIIPTKIEGLPVTTICSDCFDKICVTEIVFPEGIKRLGASVLHLKKLEKVIFPASLEYISPNVFASWNGDFKDLYLSANTIFVAPIDSYADRFLKAYSPEYFDVSILTIVNDTFEAKPIDTKLHPYELSKASMERHETFLDEIKKGGWK